MSSVHLVLSSMKSTLSHVRHCTRAHKEEKALPYAFLCVCLLVCVCVCVCVPHTTWSSLCVPSPETVLALRGGCNLISNFLFFFPFLHAVKSNAIDRDTMEQVLAALNNSGNAGTVLDKSVHHCCTLFLFSSSVCARACVCPCLRASDFAFTCLCCTPTIKGPRCSK